MKDDKHRNTGVVYVFGPFRLLPDECLLLREGQPVALTPRAFDLLRLLVESAGHLKTRDELIEVLWPTTIVDESGLPWNVNALRKALGDDSEAPHYIETVRGRGYRFIAPVEIEGAGQSEPDKENATGRRWPLVASAGLVAAAAVASVLILSWPRFFRAPLKATSASQRPSIAVLPFENLNVDKKDAYFVAGMQDLILTKLADIGGLKVISRTSTENYRSHPVDLKTIARQLGVATILEGSVQKAGDQVLIDVQLIDAETGAHIWAQTYQRTLANVFDVEGEVAKNVANTLKTKLSPAEARHLATTLSDDPVANDLYLRANYYLDRSYSQSSLQPLKQAISLYRQAIARDPDFVQAYARLSHVESWLAFVGGGGEDVKTLVTDACAQAKKALKLAPDMAQPYSAMGYCEYYDKGNYDAALEAFDAALKIKPNDVGAIEARGFVLRRQGKFNQAIEAFKRAMALTPRDISIAIALGQTYMAINRYHKAEQSLQLAKALDPGNQVAQIEYATAILFSTGNVSRALSTLQSNGAPVKEFRAYLLLFQRKYSAAIAMVESIPDKSFNYVTGPLGPKNLALGDLYRWSGDTARARMYYVKALSRFRAQLPELATHPSQIDGVWLNIADAEMGLGKTDTGIAAIKSALAADMKSRDHSGVRSSVVAAAASLYAQAGRADEAVSLISHALTMPGIGLSYAPPMLWLDPAWNPIRKDPRFHALLKKYAKYKPAKTTTTSKI